MERKIKEIFSIPVEDITALYNDVVKAISMLDKVETTDNKQEIKHILLTLLQCADLIDDVIEADD